MIWSVENWRELDNSFWYVVAVRNFYLFVSITVNRGDFGFWVTSSYVYEKSMNVFKRILIQVVIILTYDLECNS